MADGSSGSGGDIVSGRLNFAGEHNLYSKVDGQVNST